MKKYIGTKTVQAEPMNELEAVKKGLARKNEDKHEWRDGYKIVYKDGYESWSPKDVFENAYKAADTFLDRLEIEHKELMERFEKCAVFVDCEKFREIIKEDYPAFLLSLQRELMGRYMATLEQRMAIAKGETSITTLPRMSFGIAIEALKFGFAIRRRGWNGKNMFVIKQVPAHIESSVIPKMQSLPQSAKDLVLKGKGFIDYTSQCLIYNANTGRADSWNPSISDVFAEDWEILTE